MKNNTRPTKPHRPEKAGDIRLALTLYRALVERGVQFKIRGGNLWLDPLTSDRLTDEEHAQLNAVKKFLVAMMKAPAAFGATAGLPKVDEEPDEELPCEHTSDFSESYRLPEPDQLRTVDAWRRFRETCDSGTIESDWADTCLKRLQAKKARDLDTVRECNARLNRLLRERIRKP